MIDRWIHATVLSGGARLDSRATHSLIAHVFNADVPRIRQAPDQRQARVHIPRNNQF